MTVKTDKPVALNLNTYECKPLKDTLKSVPAYEKETRSVSLKIIIYLRK